MAQTDRNMQEVPDGRGLRMAIVAAQFNWHITGPLLAGAQAAFAQAGVAAEVPVFRVPGAFEIPVVAQRLARSGRFDAVLTLGAVIRGDTPHFDYVAGECARGVLDVSLATGVPVLFGVLTTDTNDQAVARAGGPHGALLEGNKGAECAFAAIETARTLQGIG